MANCLISPDKGSTKALFQRWAWWCIIIIGVHWRTLARGEAKDDPELFAWASTSASKREQSGMSSRGESAWSSSTVDNGAGSFEDEEEVILVGGNFSIGIETGVHLAQYTMSEHTWTNQFEPKLFVYGDSSGRGAAVYSLAVNRSKESVFVAGQFDSISEQSQSQYCSLGEWLGMHPTARALDRVGESGLCSRASDPATKIFATELGEGGDLFVGGSFNSRIWDGSTFVSVRHLARFDSMRTLWTPLRGDTLKSASGEAAVLALAFFKKAARLFVGGYFEISAATDDDLFANLARPVSLPSMTSAIAEWSEQSGLRPFEGGSLSNRDGTPARCVALAIDEDRSKLYVAGLFDQVGDITKLPCRTLGEYALDFPTLSSGVKTHTGWNCVLPSPFELDDRFPIALLFDGALYAAGRAASTSSWWSTANVNSTAAIARYSRFVETKYAPIVDDSDSASSSSEDSTASRKHVRHRRRQRRRLGSSPRGSSSSSISSSYADSNSNNNTHSGSQTTHRQPFSTTEVYYYAWEWLPGWRGLNGTIYVLAAGIGSLDGCVLVGGIFTASLYLCVAALALFDSRCLLRAL